ncbi:hypothetical protein OIU84_026233 [Salix udensis]|uniref:Uncharacterized protein n=1 Tax=Salix udensis TaxID=889485 RepID=A0AAD6KLG5_9ROSI|nr:hypothetical protein OIU84_026233 [Salix udensis]
MNWVSPPAMRPFIGSSAMSDPILFPSPRHPLRLNRLRLAPFEKRTPMIMTRFRNFLPACMAIPDGDMPAYDFLPIAVGVPAARSPVRAMVVQASTVFFDTPATLGT